MPLLGLPPELLLQVMELLGASFFREDTRRLTVCKHWYHLACKIFWAEIRLSSKGLSQFLVSPNVERKSQIFQSSLKSFTIDIAGFDVIRVGRHERRNLVTDPDDERMLVWRDQLNENILDLASFIQGCIGLRTLKFSASSEVFSQRLHWPRQDYLYSRALSNLLSLDTLTTLDLDTTGTSFLLQNECHLCLYIGRLLSRLHCLRLGMRTICPAALRPSKNSDSLPLKHVIVDLIFTSRTLSPENSYPKRCGSLERGEFLELKSEIEDQARLLLAQMECPKTLAIMYRSFPWHLKSLDIMTGKATTLDSDDSDFSDESEDMNS